MSPSEATGTFLSAVEMQLRDVLAPRGHFGQAPPLLQKAACHICLTQGAKRVRPQLVEQWGQALGAPPKDLVELAVVVELMHSASLLHDDIIDEGQTRRGKPTAHLLFGNATAVLAGDMLLSLALARARCLPAPVLLYAIDVVAEMTAAAMREVEARGNAHLDLEQWRLVVQGKTASLFSLCGFGAGWLAKDSDGASRLSQAARHLGMAFQLADDNADLRSSGSGKPRFADIRARNPSFTLLWAVHRIPSLGDRLQALWDQESMSSDDINDLGLAILATSVCDEVRETVRLEVQAAKEVLGPYASRPAIAPMLAWAELLWQNA